jgi:hypothetical protein
MRDPENDVWLVERVGGTSDEERKRLRIEMDMSSICNGLREIKNMFL